eukprot:3939991-Rhodomonas_salina.1
MCIRDRSVLEVGNACAAVVLDTCISDGNACAALSVRQLSDLSRAPGRRSRGGRSRSRGHGTTWTCCVPDSVSTTPPSIIH